MFDRKLRSDSVQAQVEAEQRLRDGWAVPAGLKALTKREKVAWTQHCQNRSHWNETELRGLHRVVKLETELEKLKLEASRCPRFYEKANGDFAAHPIHTECRNVQKLLHSEMRVIGLNTSVERKVGTSPNGRPDKPAPGGKANLSLLKR